MSMSDEVGRLSLMLQEAFPTGLLDTLRNFLEDETRADRVELFLACYDWSMLRRLETSGTTADGEVYRVEGGDALGRAFRGQEVVVVADGRGALACVPVSFRGEQLGVLRVGLPDRPDAEMVAGLSQVGSLVAHMVILASRYTDVFERARRLQPFSLPAELQWVLLPARGFACAEFALAGQVIPTYSVGGDQFDYQIEADTVTLMVTDAMGHGLDAAMVSALGVAALRHARRHQLALAAQMAAADAALHQRFGGEKFATALLLRIDLDTGHGLVVNAGNPGLLRLRDGEVQLVALEPELPLGMFGDTTYDDQHLVLEPGDRMLFVSDGTLEAVDAGGEQFGDCLLAEALRTSSSLGTREAVTVLQQALVNHQHGDLRDDATLVCLDWSGR